MAGLLDFLTGGLLGGQAPQQQPPAPFQGGNDPFGAAFANFAHSKSILGGISDALTGATTGQRTDPVGMYQQMAGMTYKALLDAGVPEPQARLGATNPDVQKAITAKMFPTYSFEKIGNTIGSGNPATGQFNPQYISPTVSNLGAGEVPSITYPALPGGGGVPRPGPIQSAPLAPPAGTQAPVPLGQGAPGVSAGSTVLPAGPPMSIQEKQAQTTAGTVQGQTLASLPTVKLNTETALGLADKLTNHPGAKWALGAASVLPTAPGSPQANFRALLEQAKSGVFRQAAHDLRGLGSLSNTEGSKLENSTARLEAAQSVPEFNAALQEYKMYLQKGWTNAQAIARGEMKPYATAPLEQSSGAKVSPPAGFKLAPDGKYYSEKPGTSGKYQIWTPG